MVAHYRFVFNSLRTERVIQEIDLYGVFMQMSMNGGDSQFDGTFQLDQTGKRNVDLLEATIPGSTYVVVERNDIPIGAWITWSRVYSAQSKTVQLHGLPFDSYPRRALALQDLTYIGFEQTAIFMDLWRIMQEEAYGRNINVVVPPFNLFMLPVVPKELEYLATDRKFYSELMSSIANSADGFDWYITVTREANNYYRKDLKIGYPTLGTGITDGMPIYEYPGNITQYYMTESMAETGTNIFVLGAGEGSDMISRDFEHTDLLNGGMARWDTIVTRKDIDSEDLINQVAGTIAAIKKAPGTTVKMTVKGDAVPEFGTINLGDLARIVIRDPRNPETFQADKRLIQWALRPPTGDQVEEAELLFEGDEE